VEFRFDSDELKCVWENERNSLGHGTEIDKKFRDRVRIIKNAKDERDLRALKSLHYEQLKGKRKNQTSIRLNDQWRILLQWEKYQDRKRLVIIAVADYH
jgi:toxin HigB-1